MLNVHMLKYTYKKDKDDLKKFILNMTCTHTYTNLSIYHHFKRYDKFSMIKPSEIDYKILYIKYMYIV